MDFNSAFTRLIDIESGYVSADEAKRNGDPGGETKYGISKRAHPTEDIYNLTLERAKTIYFHEYWGPSGCAVAPDALRFAIFDMAVNSGISNAAKTLQNAVGATPDGSIGPKTLLAISSMDAKRIQARFCGHRLDFMTNCTNWIPNSRGWARRVAKELKEF